MTRRDTPQQRAVREALERAGRPLSILEIHSLARDEVPAIGVRTVYRVVGRLLDDGVISPVPIPGDADRYEMAAVAATHHHHFRCESCERVFDVSGCAGRLERLLPEGFTLAGHELVLWGECAACSG